MEDNPGCYHGCYQNDDDKWVRDASEKSSYRQLNVGQDGARAGMGTRSPFFARGGIGMGTIGTGDHWLITSGGSLDAAFL